MPVKNFFRTTFHGIVKYLPKLRYYISLGTLWTTFVHKVPRLSLLKNTFRTPFHGIVQHLPNRTYQISLGTLWTTFVHEVPKLSVQKHLYDTFSRNCSTFT
jgi:hypothetical protein